MDRVQEGSVAVMISGGERNSDQRNHGLSPVGVRYQQINWGAYSERGRERWTANTSTEGNERYFGPMSWGRTSKSRAP